MWFTAMHVDRVLYAGYGYRRALSEANTTEPRGSGSRVPTLSALSGLCRVIFHKGVVG